MAVKFKNLCYKKYMNKLNLEFKYNQVISVISDDEEKVNNLFNLIYGIELPENGEITIDRKVINREIAEKKLIKIRNDIAYLNIDCNDSLFNISILDDIKYGLYKVNNKKIYELLELLNLDESILSKNYIEISQSEKKKICILSTLLKDSKVVILSNLTEYLDTKSLQNLVKYLRKEKRNNKLFIISSHDSNFLLQVTDNVIMITSDEIKFEEDKYHLFSDKKIMNEVGMDIPWVIKFKNKVLEMKNIKFNKRDNVNDLLKDIYRNATKDNE